MLDEFKNSQKIIYQMMQNAAKNQRFSHAYLIDANHYPLKSEIAIAIAKFILCPNNYTNSKNCKECTQCKRIDDGNFTELKIIKPDGAWIKKEQLEELQRQFSTKAIETKYKIYIIHEAEKMNSSAANSILKFLEEPEPGIIAILITDNMYQLLDTIISRCQIISLSNSKNYSFLEMSPQTSLEKISLFFAKTKEKYYEFINDNEKINQINYVIKFLQEIENNQELAILKENKLWTSVFNEKNKIEFGLDIMMITYKDILNKKFGLPLDFMIDFQSVVEQLSNQNSVLQLCKKIEIILEMKRRLKVNINNNLLIDQLILLFKEV